MPVMCAFLFADRPHPTSRATASVAELAGLGCDCAPGCVAVVAGIVSALGRSKLAGSNRVLGGWTLHLFAVFGFRVLRGVDVGLLAAPCCLGVMRLFTVQFSLARVGASHRRWS